MKWDRAVVEMTCGSCVATITAGAPLLLVVSGTSVRCEACAKRVFDTVPPADLPMRTPPKPPETPPFAAARDLVRDYKRAQAGDDDAPAITDRIRQVSAGKVLR